MALILEFWLHAAGGGGTIPPWAEFDPADHPKILPWILLLRRDEGAGGLRDPDWRFPVCGSGCTELLGFSCQGKLFGEIFHSEASEYGLREFDLIGNGAGPLLTRTVLAIPGRESQSVLRGVFPFADGRAGIERIMVVFAKENQRTGPKAVPRAGT